MAQIEGRIKRFEAIGTLDSCNAEVFGVSDS
jgi:hypothetical protein